MENQNHLNQREKTETAPTSPAPESPTGAVKAVESSPTPLDRPPSLSSSPSHEFSFSVSFHTPNSLSTSTGAGTALESRKLTPIPSIDFDFAPADDIFLHGHLLPLHFVSHRPSDVSIQNAAFLCVDQDEIDENVNADAAAAVSTAVIDEECKDRRNRKYFSFCWLRKFLSGSSGEAGGGEEKQGSIRRKKRVFDGVLRAWKKYARLAEPFLYLKEWREKREILRRSPHSFSGYGWRQRWRGEFSAPASSRTSPANSGLLVAASGNLSSQESALEELQNAIQSAINHCKNSGQCRNNENRC